MKKILLLVLGMIIGGGVLSVSSPVQASGLGCINYSGASFIGSVVLDASGFVIGCQQPTATGDLDLIPLSGWSTWDTYFQGPRSAFDTRLGFGCDDCWMGSDGMNGSVGIPLGFAINYYGTTYDNVFVNSNGSISFGQGAGAYNQPLNQILGQSPGVCAYCLDLQNQQQLTDSISSWNSGTRHTDFIYWGRTTFGGRPAFVATWMNIPTFAVSNAAGVWNTFQVMLVDVSDLDDDVNIIVNYGSMQNSNTHGYSDSGTSNHVAIGLGNVSGAVTIYNSIVDDSGTVLDGMLTSELWDSGSSALNTLHLNSTVPGRFIFQMQGGVLPGSIIDIGPGCTDASAINYLSGASPDNGSCKYPVVNALGIGGTGLISLSWDAPISGNISDLQYYNLRYSPGTVVLTGISSSDTGYSLSGLADNTAYSIQICAFYDLGGGETVETCTDAVHATTINPVVEAPRVAFAGGGGGGGGSSQSTRTVISTPVPIRVVDLPVVPTIIRPIIISPNIPATIPRSYVPIYDRAHENGLTSMPIEEARFEDQIQRYEAAKMIVNYVQNIEKKTIASNPLCVISTYSDYPTYDAEMKQYIQKICDLGLMGWNNPKSTGILPAFRPFDYLKTEEFNLIIDRYLDDTSHDPAQGNKRIDIMKFLKNAGVK